jgi:predicted secreted protein
MAKYSAKNTKLYFGSANPPTTLVTQTGDIEIDLGERSPLIDLSSRDNATDVNPKADPGRKEPAKISFDLVYDPADSVHADLAAKNAAHSTSYAKIELPDAGAGTFVGECRVASFVIGAPMSDKLSAKVTIELLGAFTFTA